MAQTFRRWVHPGDAPHLAIALKRYVATIEQNYSTLDSPIFTGDPQAPTPPTGDNDTSIATTAFVKNQGYGVGTITGVTAGTGLNGGGTSGTVTLNLANTAVAVGSYNYASITVDAQGRLTAAASGIAPVALPVSVPNGGTGITAGVSGGIPYYNATTTMASSALLAANTLVVGGGAGAAPATSPNWTIGSAGPALIGNNNAVAPVNRLANDLLFLQQVDGSPSVIRLTGFNNGGALTGQASSGTGSSPTALAGQLPLVLNMVGYDGSTWAQAAQLRFAPQTNPWTTSDHGSAVQFFTTPVGSTTLDATPCASFVSTGVALRGTTTNDNATTGNVGEYIVSTVLAGSAVSVTTSTNTNITSISLTAGDWDVDGKIAIAPSATVTTYVGWVNSTSVTAPANAVSGITGATASFTVLIMAPTGTRRFSLASTTTVYLSCVATFASGTCTAYGEIRARRAR